MLDLASLAIAALAIWSEPTHCDAQDRDTLSVLLMTSAAAHAEGQEELRKAVGVDLPRPRAILGRIEAIDRACAAL